METQTHASYVLLMKTDTTHGRGHTNKQKWYFKGSRSEEASTPGYLSPWPC